MSNPPLWMPGALRIESTRRNPLNGNGFRLLTWHSFEAGYSLSVENALRILIRNGSEAFVFHPITGQWGQCQPMNTAARTLKSSAAYPTNRFGTVHQQVEVIAYAKNPWTRDLTPAGRAGLQRGLDFFRSWGIPDQWAWKNQPPPRYPGGSVRRRNPEQSGHAYHSGWPVNDHGDPGAIDPPWEIRATDPTRPRLGDRGEIVATVQALLVRWGYELDRDGVFGPATDAAVRSFQRQHALEVDGIVGPATMAALNKPTSPPTPPTPTPKEIDDMNSDELRALIREEVERVVYSERTARTVMTTYPIMLDPRDPFAPRRTPSNVIEHAAGILHDDDGKPMQSDDGGFVKPAGYVSGV